MNTALEQEFHEIRERLKNTEAQLHHERKARKHLEKQVRKIWYYHPITLLSIKSVVLDVFAQRIFLKEIFTVLFQFLKSRLGFETCNLRRRCLAVKSRMTHFCHQLRQAIFMLELFYQIAGLCFFEQKTSF